MLVSCSEPAWVPAYPPRGASVGSADATTGRARAVQRTWWGLCSWGWQLSLIGIIHVDYI
jgi:hypothetical protein